MDTARIVKLQRIVDAARTQQYISRELGNEVVTDQQLAGFQAVDAELDAALDDLGLEGFDAAASLKHLMEKAEREAQAAEFEKYQERAQ